MPSPSRTGEQVARDVQGQPALSSPISLLERRGHRGLCPVSMQEREDQLEGPVGGPRAEHRAVGGRRSKLGCSAAACARTRGFSCSFVGLESSAGWKADTASLSPVLFEITERSHRFPISQRQAWTRSERRASTDSLLQFAPTDFSF